MRNNYRRITSPFLLFCCFSLFFLLAIQAKEENDDAVMSLMKEISELPESFFYQQWSIDDWLRYIRCAYSFQSAQHSVRKKALEKYSCAVRDMGNSMSSNGDVGAGSKARVLLRLVFEAESWNQDLYSAFYRKNRVLSFSIRKANGPVFYSGLGYTPLSDYISLLRNAKIRPLSEFRFECDNQVYSFELAKSPEKK